MKIYYNSYSCGQTVGWIKMPLGKEVGLGPGHIVLDGNQWGPSPPQQPFPTFGPCLLWPNGRPSQQLLALVYILLLPLSVCLCLLSDWRI